LTHRKLIDWYLPASNDDLKFCVLNVVVN